MKNANSEKKLTYFWTERLGTACQKHERPNKRKLCLDGFLKKAGQKRPNFDNK